MKSVFRRLGSGALLCVIIITYSNNSNAGHSHYTNGVEGIRLGTVPGPGFYWKVNNLLYTADRRVGADGRRSGMNVNVAAQAHRFIYSSDFALLGGYWVADASVSMKYSDIEVGGKPNSGSNFGLGDVLIRPAIIRWHGDRWDAVAGVGFYAPVGDFDPKDPSTLGKGFWTGLIGGGGTLYLDKERTWSLSAIGYYETHSRQRHTRTSPGDDIHFEWAVAKKLTPTFEIGVVGYAQWQLGRDELRDGTKIPGRERAFAAGPELRYTIQPWRTTLQLRSIWEFENRHSTEGNMTVFSITKAF